MMSSSEVGTPVSNYKPEEAAQTLYQTLLQVHHAVHVPVNGLLYRFAGIIFSILQTLGLDYFGERPLSNFLDYSVI